MSDLRVKSRGEGGFTIPELLIVIVIIGILLAIAVPSFLGARKDGQDSMAHGSLHSGLAAERTYYVDHQVYTTDATALRTIEPNLLWTTTDAKTQGVMAVTGGSPAGSVVVIASTSPSGYQFCIMQVATDQGSAVNGQTLAGTYYKRNPSTVNPPSTSISLAQCGATGYTRDKTAGWATT